MSPCDGVARGSHHLNPSRDSIFIYYILKIIFPRKYRSGGGEYIAPRVEFLWSGRLDSFKAERDSGN